MQKGLAPILIVILIALAVGGYLLYQKQIRSNNVSSLQEPYSGPKSANKLVVSSIPENWKVATGRATFINQAFSFKYPPDWEYESKEGSQLLSYIGEDKKKYYVYFCTGGSGFSAPRPVEYTGDNLTYDNLEIAKRIWKYKDNGNVYYVAVDLLDTDINKGCLILFYLPEINQNQYLKLFDQILSTFKFN